MYEVMVKLAEPRSTAMAGPLRFASKEERHQYVHGPDSQVFWYFYPEDEGWDWRRGGAWKATEKPGPADRTNTPPDITSKDRRW